jgi:hypothetical protein
MNHLPSDVNRKCLTESLVYMWSGDKDLYYYEMTGGTF